MLSVNEVWDLIDRETHPLPAQRLPLEQALGCILQEAVAADADQPAFSRSAIDGFAVAEHAPVGRYRIAGEVKPGRAAPEIPTPGKAWKIFTGSALPESGVALVMIEDTEIEGDHVIIKKAPEISLIRPRASQCRKGDTLLKAGTELGAGALAILASVGLVEPLVIPPVRAAHVSTGSEIIPATQTPAAGFIRDSNTPLIAGLLHDAGAERIFHSHVSENVEEALSALKTGQADFSLLLLSGGASVGAYDGARETLERLGFTIHCAKVRSRPGKPMIFAAREEAVAFGLPGNPLAHFVCFHLFVRRAIDRLMGRKPPNLLWVKIEGDHPAADARETWWPARLRSAKGCLSAEPLSWRDSSDLTSLARANSLLRISSEPTNGLVEAVLFGRLEA